MIIPKIIHQIWVGGEMPKLLKPLTETWRDLHPDWEYIFWDDKKCLDFITVKFPHFLNTYRNYESQVQRADIIRYLILFEIGGIYVDMDFECFNNLEMILHDKLCVLSKEPIDHCIQNRKAILIGNAFIASIPKHRFIESLINEIKKPVKYFTDKNTIIMESTGPYMVTRAFQDYKNNDLTILEPEFVYPLTRDEITTMFQEDEYDPVLQLKLDNSVAVHYWVNSWTV